MLCDWYLNILLALLLDKEFPTQSERIVHCCGSIVLRAELRLCNTVHLSDRSVYLAMTCEKCH